MPQRPNNRDGYYEPEDELTLIYVHMIYDTTKIGIDAVLHMAVKSSGENWKNLVDEPQFALEGLLVDSGPKGLAIYPVIAVKHPFFKRPVLLTAADREGTIYYFDIEVEPDRAVVHWDPLEFCADRTYSLSLINERSQPPSLSELLNREKIWLYKPLVNQNTAEMSQDEQVDTVLNGLGISPEAFYGPDREIFLHAMKQGLGLTFLPPNIT